MAYAAPLGNDVQFNFTASGYTPPGGSAVAIDFQGSTLDVSIVGSGGALVGGAASDEAAYVYDETASGGALVGGVAPNQLDVPNIYDEDGTGGALVGGTADEMFTGSMDFMASGGVLVAGDAPNEAAYVYDETGAGGALIGGTADEDYIAPAFFDEIASGGALVAGVADLSTLIQEPDPQGGVLVGGAATIGNFNVMEYIENGSGGALVGGAASNTIQYPSMDVVLPRPNASIDANFNDFIHARFNAPIWASVYGQEGAWVDATLPRTASDITGLVGRSGTVEASLVALSASMSGEVNVVEGVLALLPVPQAAINAIAGSAGAVDTRLPYVSATADAYTVTTASLNTRLYAVAPELSALNGTVGTVDVGMHRLRPDILAARGTAGTLLSKLPSMKTAAGGYSSVSGTVDVAAPAITAGLTASMEVQFFATYVMNTLTSALSEYSYGFNSFCQIDDKYYAAGPDGLYQIEFAGDDNGVEIAAKMSTGDLDFDDEMQKRISDFYMGVRTEGDLVLRIATDENEPVEYELKPYAVNTLKQRRVITAKGARGKYWRFEIENTNGCDFEIDTMNIAVVPVARRI